VLQAIPVAWLTFKDGADLPPGSDPSLAGVLPQRRLQEEQGDPAGEEEDEVRDEEGSCREGWDAASETSLKRYPHHPLPGTQGHSWNWLENHKLFLRIDCATSIKKNKGLQHHHFSEKKIQAWSVLHYCSTSEFGLGRNLEVRSNQARG